MKKFNIAIDGPSGVGKSTIAKKIARQYNMIHLDTGAMYRCIAYFLKNNPGNIEEKLDQIQIQFDNNHVFLNQQDVTDEIRNEEISLLASDVAKNEKVRHFLVSKQREIAKNQGFILDGRDIGSVVLPDAQVKFYLSASAEVRAQRRFNEYQSKNIKVELKDLLNDIEKRDLQDSTRAHSPLIKVVDAYELDTSNKSIEEVIAEACEYIERKVQLWFLV